MHPYQEQLEPVLQILKEAKQSIGSHLDKPELALLQHRLFTYLDKEILFVEFQLGIEKHQADEITNPLRVTSFLGTEIKNAAPKNDIAEFNTTDQTPEAGKNVAPAELAKQNEADALREKIPSLTKALVEMEADNVVDSMNDIEIRAVAISAGLPVTATSPEKITVAFINQIKDAIAKKQEIATLGNTNNTNTADDANGANATKVSNKVDNGNASNASTQTLEAGKNVAAKQSVDKSKK